MAVRRPRSLIALGSVVLAAAAVLGIWLGGSDGDASPAIPGDSITVIDPRSGRAEAPVEVGGSPSQLALAAGAVWVGDTSNGSIGRVDPEARVRRGDGAASRPAGWDRGGRRLGLGDRRAHRLPWPGSARRRTRSSRPWPSRAAARRRRRRRRGLGGEPVRPLGHADRCAQRAGGLDRPSRRITDRHRRECRRGVDDERDRRERVAHRSADRPGAPAHRHRHSRARSRWATASSGSPTRSTAPSRGSTRPATPCRRPSRSARGPPASRPAVTACGSRTSSRGRS